MRTRSRIPVRLGLVALLLAFAAPAAAEDVEKKWRFGFSAGSLNAQDSVRSDAANILNLVGPDLAIEFRFIDPRNDSAALGALEIQPGAEFNFSAQYAVTKIFVVEGSVGYQRTDVGDTEVQAQFVGVPIDEDLNFNFAAFRIPVGELERVPIQITALARLRPRARLNPYFGIGIGYSIIGFEPSAEFDELSQNMDNSRGLQAFLTDSLFGAPQLITPPSAAVLELTGANVDARDTFEWHTVLGTELSFGPKWAVFVDLRYLLSSRTLRVGFNGGGDVGVGVPLLTDFVLSEAGGQSYGAVNIMEGGLVDGGRLIPLVSSPPTTDCSIEVNIPLCTFVPELDGELDPGLYYVQGGKMKYDAFGARIGVRFTF